MYAVHGIIACKDLFSLQPKHKSDCNQPWHQTKKSPARTGLLLNQHETQSRVFNAPLFGVQIIPTSLAGTSEGFSLWGYDKTKLPKGQVFDLNSQYSGHAALEPSARLEKILQVESRDHEQAQVPWQCQFEELAASKKHPCHIG